MLWLCCGCVAVVLWLWCCCVVVVLWLCCGCVVVVLWLCCGCVAVVLRLCCGCGVVVLWLCCGCVAVVLRLCCGCGVLHNTTIKHRYKIKISHAMAPVPAITRNRKRTARCCSARVGTTVFQMNSIMFGPSVCHSLKYEFVSVCSKLYAFPNARLAVLKTYSQRC